MIYAGFALWSICLGFAVTSVLYHQSAKRLWPIDSIEKAQAHKRLINASTARMTIAALLSLCACACFIIARIIKGAPL